VRRSRASMSERTACLRPRASARRARTAGPRATPPRPRRGGGGAPPGGTATNPGAPLPASTPAAPRPPRPRAGEAPLPGTSPDPKVVGSGPALPCGLVAREASAWLATSPDGLARVDYDRATGSRVAWGRPVIARTAALAFGHGSIWAVENGQATIRRTDPNTG